MEKTVRNRLYKDYDPYTFSGDLLPLDAQGFNSRSPSLLEKLLECKPKLIIEVGSWKGASAMFMADALREHYTDFEIVCVDTWLGSVEHWDNTYFNDKFINGRPNLYEQFRSNIVHERLTDFITPFPIDSTNAFEYFKTNKISADFIYIDAGHDYSSVRMDLINYAEILRPGGYMVGDDWFHEPIKQAAYDTFGDKVIELSVDKYLWVK
jgi:predicted O-methyltransferase YrrM